MAFCPSCKNAWVDRHKLGRFLEFAGNTRLQSLHPPSTADDEIDVEERDRAFAFFFQLPLELSKHVSKSPPISLLIIGVCLVLFKLDLFAEGELTLNLALNPSELTLGGWYRAITSIFLHANWLHLAFNMYFLYAFGRLAEDRLGDIGMFALFIASGIGAKLMFLGMHWGQDIYLLGASGAISGVMGFYFVLFPLRKVGWSLYFFVIRIPAAIYLGLWIMLQISHLGSSGTVAYSSHVGGFSSGIVFGLMIRFNLLGFNDKIVGLPGIFRA